LTAVGVVTGVGAGIYKVNNYFKRRFSGNREMDIKQKAEDINKLTDMVEKDKNAPWNKKMDMQSKPESDWKAKPKPFNPDKFKPSSKYAGPSMEPKLSTDEASNYPAGTENNPEAPFNQDDSGVEHSSAAKLFKPMAMNSEIAILDGPDGKYAFYYDDIDRAQFPNAKFELTSDDLADYINQNFKTIPKGVGMKGWDSGALLIKIDDELKNELIQLYSKNKDLVNVLHTLQEMTSAAGGSSGAFTTKLGDTNRKQNNLSPAETLEEMDTTTGGGGPVSSSTGQYVQPAIWANGKKNWKASKKTQYPKGEMVSFDPCTKLNNNKSAQKGKCSQGAVDNVVKTHGTKQSVISKTVYEEVAKRTGKTVDEVQKIIEVKLNKDKSLS